MHVSGSASTPYEEDVGASLEKAYFNNIILC